MKLRVMPIFITVIVSATLLFGGWFTYRQLTLYSPLTKIVQNYPGVNASHISINPKEVMLKLDLAPSADLGGLVQTLNKQGTDIWGTRTLQLEVTDHSNTELDKVWENAMFSVSQAMATQKYTEIPETVESIMQQNKNIQVKAEMDERNVYVSLSNGKGSKFLILPRNSQVTGGSA